MYMSSRTKGVPRTRQKDIIYYMRYIYIYIIRINGILRERASEYDDSRVYNNVYIYRYIVCARVCILCLLTTTIRINEVKSCGDFLLCTRLSILL